MLDDVQQQGAVFDGAAFDPDAVANGRGKGVFNTVFGAFQERDVLEGARTAGAPPQAHDGFLLVVPVDVAAIDPLRSIEELTDHPLLPLPSLAVDVLDDREVTERLDIPTIGIGAGVDAAAEARTASDGQLAAVVKDIKLGTGVVSLAYHNPLWVAERAVQLDHMTGGRVIFGTGPGALPSDANAMGIDPMTQRDRQVVITRALKGFGILRVTLLMTLITAR